ncbi:MAG: hypothetical protein BIFFINMI_00898 [Phycisphaerae bacterium]|nr:hypothetical protein [Phycisphaerae bacterium]
MRADSRALNWLRHLYRRVLTRQFAARRGRRPKPAVRRPAVRSRRRLAAVRRVAPRLDLLEPRLLLSAAIVGSTLGNVLTLDITDASNGAHAIVIENDAAAGKFHVTIDGGSANVFSNPAGAGAGLVVNTPGGADTITVNALDAAFDATFTLNSQGGADHVIVSAFTGSQAWQINSGSGDDDIEVNLTGNQALTVDGGGGTGDSLTLDAQGKAITSHSGSAAGFTGGASAGFSNTESVVVTDTATPLSDLVDPAALKAAIDDLPNKLANLTKLSLQIPFTTLSIDDLFGVTTALESLVSQYDSTIATNGSATTQTVVDFLNAFSSTSGGVTLSFTGTPGAAVQLVGQPTQVTFTGLTLGTSASVTTPLFLGADAEELGLAIAGSPPNLTIQADLGLDFSFGALDDTAGPSTGPDTAIDQVSGYTAHLKIDNAGSPAALADFDLNVGVLGTHVTGGTILLDATVAETLDANGDSTGSALSGSAYATLPAAVKAGLTTATSIDGNILVGSAAIDLADMMIQTGPLVSGGPDVTRLEGPPTFISSDLLAFASLTGADLTADLPRIATFLDHLGDSSTYSGLLPLVDGVNLNNLFGFNHLIDVADGADPRSSDYGFGNAFRSAFATEADHTFTGFDTIQELVAAGGAGLSADYDPATGELLFHVAASQDGPPIDLPYSFNLSLDSLSQVAIDANVTLTLNVGLAVDYGVKLKPDPSAQAAILSDPDVTLPADGQVTGDQLHFDLVLGNLAPVEVLVDTSAATDPASLAALIDSAVSAALVSADLPGDEVAVSITGGRLKLSLNSNSIYQRLAIAAHLPPTHLGVGPTQAEIDAALADPIFTELGMADGRFATAAHAFVLSNDQVTVPSNGQVAGNVLAFDLLLGNRPAVHVVVGDQLKADGSANAADTLADNASLDDLVADMNAAVSDALLHAGLPGDAVVVTRYTSYDTDSPIERIKLTLGPGAVDVMLRLLTDPAGAAQADLGLMNTEAGVADAVGPMYLVEGSQVNAAVKLEVSDAAATGVYNILATEIADAHARGYLSLDTTVVDTDWQPGDGHVRTPELSYSADAVTIPTAAGLTQTLPGSPASDDDIDAIARAAGTDLQLVMNLPGLVGGSSTQFDVVVTSTDLTARENTVSLTPLAVSVTSPAQTVADHLTYAQAFSVLHEAGLFMVGVLDDVSLLQSVLPLIGLSASQLNNFTTSFNSLVDTLSKQAPPATLQDLDALVGQGLNTTTQIFTVAGDKVLIDLSFISATPTAVPYAVDVASLNALASTPPLADPRTLNVTDSVTLPVNATATVNVGMDLDFSAVSQPADEPVTHIHDSSTLHLEVSLSSSNDSLNALYGPATLLLNGAQVSVTDASGAGPAAYDIAFDSPSGAALDLDTVLAGDLDAQLTSTLSGKAAFSAALQTAADPSLGTLGIMIADLLAATQGAAGSVAFTSPVPDLDSLVTANPDDPDPLDTLLRDPNVLLNGFDAMLRQIENVSRTVFQAIGQVPLVGDRIVQPILDFITRLKQARGRVRTELLLAVQDDSQRMVDQIQTILFDVYGPNSPNGLDLLLDLPTGRSGSQGATIDPADVNATEQSNDYVEYNMHLGQSVTLASQPFDLGIGLASLPGLSGNFPGFGFNVSGDGVQLVFNWDFYYNFGVSLSDGFYYRTDATDPHGVDTPELNFSFDATTPGLTGTLGSGLAQSNFSDGTKIAASITGLQGVISLDTSDIAQDFIAAFYHDYTADFHLLVGHNNSTVIDDYHINYELHGGQNILSFLLDANAYLFGVTSDHGTPLQMLLTLNLSDLLNPTIVLTSSDPTATNIQVVTSGGPQWGLANGQTDDQRSIGLGFRNGQTSSVSLVDASRNDLIAAAAAPTDGRVLWDTGLMLTVTDTAHGARAVPIALSHKDDSLTSISALVSAVQADVNGYLGDSPADQTVTVLYDAGAGKLVFRTKDLDTTLEISGIDPLEHTHLALGFGIDFVDSPLGIGGDDRLLLGEFLGATNIFQVLVPDVSIDGKIRLAVDTNLNSITNNIEAAFGAVPGVLGLPSLQYDLKIDAGLPSLAELIFLGTGKGPIDWIKTAAGKGGAATPSSQRSLLAQFIQRFEFDNIRLSVGDLLNNVIGPVAYGINTALDPVINFVGDGTGAVAGWTSQDIPGLSNLGIHVSVDDLLTYAFGGFNPLNTFQDAVGVVRGLNNLIGTLGSTGTLNLGGWELNMDQSSPLYFPRLKRPIPIVIGNTIGSAVQGLFNLLTKLYEASGGTDSNPLGFTGLDVSTIAGYMNVQGFAALAPYSDNLDIAGLPSGGGFKVDLLSFSSIFDWLTGQPFDIFSFSLPQIHAQTDYKIPFSLDIGGYTLNFGSGIDLRAALNIDFSIVYDSTGLQRMVSALRAGATPDPTSLLDGFYIHSGPGAGMSFSFDFSASAQAGPIRTPRICIPLVGCIPSITLFEAHASINAGMSLGLDIRDPNNDGRLRLNEIFYVTDDFAQPQNLIEIFDPTLNVHGGFDFGGTLVGASISASDLGFDPHFNLTLSLSDLLGYAGLIPAIDPVLAEVTTLPAIFGNPTPQKVLRLNTGPLAYARIEGDTSDADGPVSYTISSSGDTLTVSGFGASNAFSISSLLAQGVAGIVGYGSDFNDTFNLSGLASAALPVEIHGGAGSDTLRGGAGVNSLYGELGNDHLYGGGSADTLDGGAGNDDLHGGGGADRLIGGTGNDQLFGQGGDDTYLFADGWGVDQITETRDDGQHDAIDMSAVTVGLVVTMDVHGTNVTDGVNSVTALGGLADGLRVENITTGSGDDLFLISASELNADTNNDTIPDLFFQTLLDGGNGNDTYRFFLGDPRAIPLSPVVTAENAIQLLSADASFWLRVEDGDAQKVTITKDAGNQASAPAGTLANLLADINAALAPYHVAASFAGGKLQFVSTDNSLIAIYGDADTHAADLGIADILATLQLGDIGPHDTGYTWNVDQLLADGSQQADIVGLTNQAITVRRADQPESDTRTITYGTGGADSGVEVMTLRLRGGDDQVNVQSTPADSSVQILGQGGDDIFRFGVDQAAYEPGQIDSVVFAGPLASADGRHPDAASFLLEVGGYDPLTVALPANTTNTTQAQLVDDLNAAVDDALTAAGLDAGLVDVSLFTGGDGVTRLTFTSSGPTLNLYAAGPSDPAATLLGLPVPANLNDLDGNQLNGPIRVDGGFGVNTLLLFDTSDTADNQGLLTDTHIRGLGMTQGIDYLGIQALGIYLGGGSDTMNIPIVAATLTGRAAVFGRAGDDVLNVASTVELTSTGPTAFDGTQGTLNDITGGLLLVGGGGSDTLNASDIADTADNDGTLTESLLTGLGMAVGIEYYGIDTFNLDLGSGNDRFNVRGTSAHTFLDAGPGDDLIYVSSGANLAALDSYAPPAGGADLADLHDTILHADAGARPGGTLDYVTGTLHIEAGAGHNSLAVSDHNDPDPDTGVTITSSAIVGLAPAEIDYAATGGDFSGQGVWTLALGNIGLFGSGICIYAGAGADAITVASLLDDGVAMGVPFERTATSLFAGAGSDEVTVTAAASLGVLLLVRGQEDDDTLDASGTTLRAFLFGDGGGDTLVGNDSGNVLIGDSGQVYFVRPSVYDDSQAFDVVLGGPHRPGDLPSPDIDEDFTTLDIAIANPGADDGADTIIAGAADDVILGGDSGSGPGDTISAGEGDNLVFGDNGEVYFHDGLLHLARSTDGGDGGDDHITAGGGNDRIAGGAGGDTVDAGDGLNVVLGDSAQFQYSQGVGVLELFWSLFPDTGGDDYITTGAGNDLLIGGAGNDTLDPGAGDDIAIGDNGLMQLNGPDGDPFTPDIVRATAPTAGGGDDTFVETPGSIDWLIDAAGIDTVDFSGAGSAIAFNLALDNGQYQYVDAARNVVRLTGVFENLIGGAFDDRLTGNASDNVIMGGGGNDRIWGQGGNDSLRGGEGADQLYGGAGDDDLHGDAGDDTLYGQGGDNRLDGGAGNDRLVGPGLADYSLDPAAVTVNLLTRSATDGWGGHDSLVGISGAIGSDYDDSLTGDNRNNVLIGGPGDDTIMGLRGRDVIEGGAGDDTIDGGRDADIVDYRNDPAGVTVNLLTHSATDGYGGHDTIAGVEGIYGSQQADSLTGDNAGNTIFGMGGADQLFGLGGNDSLDGGDGGDMLDGGDGRDTLHGGEGDDELHGGTGNDRLYGDGGDDSLDGGAGRDAIDGGAGGDTADYSAAPGAVVASMRRGWARNDGYGGRDTIRNVENAIGSAQGDWIESAIGGLVHGGEGDDTLVSSAADNWLFGDGGADTLIGDRRGHDHLVGGEGDDTLIGAASRGQLTWADYSFDPAGVTVNLSIGQATDGYGDHDTLVDVLGVIGSSDDDTLTGDGRDNIFIGNAGDDAIDGGGGFNTIDYSADPAGVTVDLAAGTAADGFGDSDTLANIQGIEGSAYADDLAGDDQANVIHGNGGDDTIAGRGGDDMLYGDAGDDTIDSAGGNDRVDGGAGVNTLDLSSAPAGVSVDLSRSRVDDDGTGGQDRLANIANVTGSSHDDTIRGDNSDNVLAGGDGGDTLMGEGGDDTIRGGEGDDTLLAAWGNDTLAGDAGDDTLIGDRGSNVLIGGAGDDLLLGSVGVGGAGRAYNLVSYADDPAGVTVDLAAGSADDGFGGHDTLADINGAIGSAHDDRLYGDDAANFLAGGDGADTIDGRGGDDAIRGDGGADVLTGGSGRNTVEYSSSTAGVVIDVNGGTALDGIGPANGGAGSGDAIDGFEIIVGSAFDDRFIAGAGDHRYDGAGGSDTIDYSAAPAGVDVNLARRVAWDNGFGGMDRYESTENVTGSSHADTIRGDGSANVLAGGAGDDLLDGNGGDDRLRGGAGDDTLIGNGSRGAADYSTDPAAVSVDLEAGLATDGWGDTDTLVNIRVAIGSDYADALTGSHLNDELHGGGGDDLIDGAGGDDLIFGDGGNNRLLGGEGNDTIDTGAGNNRVDPGPGADTLYVGSGMNLILGDLGQDVIYAQGGSGRAL